MRKRAVRFAVSALSSAPSFFINAGEVTGATAAAGMTTTVATALTSGQWSSTPMAVGVYSSGYGGQPLKPSAKNQKRRTGRRCGWALFPALPYANESSAY